MRRIVGKILLLIMFVMCLSSVMSAGDTIVSNGLCYMMQPDDSTLCLISPVEGYDSESVVIPSQVDGYHVTAIASGAFEQCQWLTAVSLPASLTVIGGW